MIISTRRLKQDQRAIETERSTAIETRFNSKTIRTGCSQTKLFSKFFECFPQRSENAVKENFDFVNVSLAFGGFCRDSYVKNIVELFFSFFCLSTFNFRSKRTPCNLFRLGIKIKIYYQKY